MAREQALQDGIPEYYAEAVEAEDIDAIAAPEIDITEGEEAATSTSTPSSRCGPSSNSRLRRACASSSTHAAVDDEAVDAQIDGLRERFADLEDKTAPLADGDYAQIDITGHVHDEVVDALSATDYLYEVGSDGLVPALDEELRGKRPGDILEFNDTLPERFGDLAGQEVAFQVLVKETKRKVLPEPTDEWVVRGQRVRHPRGVARRQPRPHLDDRQAAGADDPCATSVLEELASLVPSEVPEALDPTGHGARLHDLVHRLEAQGVDDPRYLAATGQDEKTFVDRIREGATDAVLADLALRCGRRAGADRGDRRGARRRDRPCGRANRRKARARCGAISNGEA